MWNLKSSNRILDQRNKQRAHIKHLENLRNIKSSINNGPPRQYAFLKHKAKTILQKQERESEIERENTILVNRMVTMPSFVADLQKSEPHYISSLNGAYTRKVQKKIDKDNQRFVMRLQRVNSKYSQKQFSKSVLSYYKAKSSIAYSKMDNIYDMDYCGLHTLNKMQSATLKRSRPFSAKK